MQGVIHTSIVASLNRLGKDRSNLGSALGLYQAVAMFASDPCNALFYFYFALAFSLRRARCGGEEEVDEERRLRCRLTSL